MASFLSRLLGLGESEHAVLRGVPVVVINQRDDIRTSDTLDRLDEALGLIETYAPIRLRHLRRDVRQIRVERFPTRGAFLPAERDIITELTFLARRDISAAPVAASILHESVHARVHAFAERVLGGRGAGWSMAREERLCRRAELAFGHALPPELGAPVIERAAATLSMADSDVAPVVDWELARKRQDEVERG